jgi:hypothetical protein
LNGWFSRVFNKDPIYLSELNSLFKFDLPDTDNNVLRAIDKLSTFAEEYANEILTSIEKPHPDLFTAKEKVNTFYRDTSKMETRLSQKVKELTDLRDEFIKMSANA